MMQTLDEKLFEYLVLEFVNVDQREPSLRFDPTRNK